MADLQSALGRLYTVKETAEALRKTPGALYQERYRDEPPGNLAISIGRKLLWRESDLVDYLEQQAANR